MFSHHLDVDGFSKSSAVYIISTVWLFAYNGGEVKQYETVQMKCHYRNSGWKVMNVYITESDVPAILGISSIKLLNVMKLQCDDVQLQRQPLSHKINGIEDFKATYPKSFDQLGNFPGEYHITIDCDVPPVMHTPPKYVIQGKDIIKADIVKMEAMGVIIHEDETTDWVSSPTFKP